MSHDTAPISVKRERSSSPSCSGDPRRKAPRLLPSSTIGQSSQHCLHCSGTDHTWTKCDRLCLQCWGRHPRKRCPKLTFDNYTPGEFSVLENRPCSSDGPSSQTFENFVPPADLKQLRESAAQDPKNNVPPVDLKPPNESAVQPAKWSGEAADMEGVTAERQAMIAMTPASSVAPYCALPQDVGGPLATGINAVPVGVHVPDAYMLGLHAATGQHTSDINAFPPGAQAPHPYMHGLHPMNGHQTLAFNAVPLGPQYPNASFFGPHPAEALRGSSIEMMNENAKQSVAPENQHCWEILKHQIKYAVYASQSPAAPVNNGRDIQEMNALISRALNILKPAITRLN